MQYPLINVFDIILGALLGILKAERLNAHQFNLRSIKYVISTIVLSSDRMADGLGSALHSIIY
ncbi:hypothetical protein OUHCRE11_40140 [Enterobacter asburiae]|nr:hypothetical protein ENTKAS01_17280 [Enterobacter sp. AS-1]